MPSPLPHPVGEFQAAALDLIEAAASELVRIAVCFHGNELDTQTIAHAQQALYVARLRVTQIQWPDTRVSREWDKDRDRSKNL